jgi:hypothetical protein
MLLLREVASGDAEGRIGPGLIERGYVAYPSGKDDREFRGEWNVWCEMEPCRGGTGTGTERGEVESKDGDIGMEGRRVCVGEMATAELLRALE